MIDRLVLIDYENLQQVNLNSLPESTRILLFHGVGQNRLPDTLVHQTQRFGDSLKWIKITGQGRNALDFHIAFYLGRELLDRPYTDCVIVSHDRGFDPLIRHMQEGFNLNCRRIVALEEAFPALPGLTSPQSVRRVPLRNAGQIPPAPATQALPKSDPSLSRLVSLLTKQQTLPAKKKGLRNLAKTVFKNLDDSDVDKLLHSLFVHQYVEELKTMHLKYLLP